MALFLMDKPHRIHIANSVRLILAMFRLYADIETDFGKAALVLLKRAYPDQKIDADPAQVGHKMMNIARKQLQYNDTDAMDAIQEYLAYVSTGSKFETDEEGNRAKFKVDEEGNPVLDEEGKPIPDPEGEYISRVTPDPFDFAAGAETWQEALGNMYSNLRRKGITRSMKKIERGQKERGIDEAFGRRTDEGGAEGGAERMPTSEETLLGKSLDDAAALKEFYTLIDEHIPDLKASMSEDVRAFFELVFDHNIGGFGSDIKENMGQATEFKEKFPEVYQRFLDKWEGKVKNIGLKWSSYVGDLRKKVLKEIWDYIETEMSNKDYLRLKDQFFSDVDPSAMRRQERQKGEEKGAYQQMRDENSLARLKAKLEKDGKLSDSDQQKFNRIKEKLEKQGVDVEAIKADPHAGAAGAREKREEEGTSSMASMAITVGMALHLTSLTTRPSWISARD